MTDLTQETDLDTEEDIDGIFDDDSSEEEVEEVVEQKLEPEPKEPEEEEQKGETEEEATEEEAKTEETETPSENKTVPLAALTDTRRKLREAEEELRKYKQPEQSVELPDPVEDPEGYKEAIKEQALQEMQVKRINDSRDKMLDTHLDYEEKEKAYMVLQGLNPALQKEMLESPDPAKFAYDKATEYIQSLAPKADPVETPAEPSESELRNKSAVQVPNLTKSASKGTNSIQLEVEGDIEDIIGEDPY